MFREWLRVEVLWSTIEHEAQILFNTMNEVCQKIRGGEMLDSYMDEAKQKHRNDAFQYELGLMKSHGKGVGVEIKKALTQAGHRCLCR